MPKQEKQFIFKMLRHFCFCVKGFVPLEVNSPFTLDVMALFSFSMNENKDNMIIFFITIFLSEQHDL